MDAVPADHELVRSYAREGSEAAFRALVARHVNLVFAAAHRQVGDSGMAEEITQNVFVALSRKAPRLVGHETLAGWLHRTAILESKARIRLELRRRRREESAATLAAVLPETSTDGLNELAPLLDEALLNLREKDRLAVVLRYLEERSLREVGAVLGVDEDAARKRIARALERLSAFFRMRGFAVPAGGSAVVLGQAAAQGAPVGLAGTAAAAGLASGGAVSGLNLLLMHVMTWSKTQALVLGVAVVGIPVFWQDRSLAALREVDARIEIEETAAASRLDALTTEAKQLASAMEQARHDLREAEARAKTLEARLAAKPSTAPYRWNDGMSVARIPKGMLRQLPWSGLANRRGELNPIIKTVLQFTESETQGVQAALDRFLAAYHQATASAMRPVEPLPEEVGDGRPDEVRVFAVDDLSAVVRELRGDLLEGLRGILDSERYEIFVQSLRDSMPIDDRERGVNSGMIVYPDAHRISVSPMPESTPEIPMLRWSLSSPGKYLMNMTREIRDIPEFMRPYLQDWIDAAIRSSATGPVSETGPHVVGE